MHFRDTVCVLFALMACSGRTLGAEPGSGSDARANEFDFSLSAGGSRTDNIRRTTADESNGTIGQAGVALAYARSGSRLDADINADLAYAYYSDDAFEDEVVGAFGGTAIFSIAPERFTWFVQNNFGQERSDPFAAVTPDNRENVNYFTTGPDVSLRLGGATSLVLAGRYSDTRYETSDLDGERYGGTLSLVRRLSAASTTSVNLSTERLEYDAAGVATPDYDRHQAFVRFATDGARTALSVDAGYTQVDDGIETADGLLARIELSRRLSPSATLAVSAGTQFSDAADLFRDNQAQFGAGGADTQLVIATNDAFESRFAGVAWSFARNRTTMGLAVDYDDNEYVNETMFNRTLTTWDAYATRQMSRRVGLSLRGRFTREDFESLDFDVDELEITAALSWALGPTVRLRLQYDRFDRESSNPLTDYTENRASLFFDWSPLARP